MDRDLHPRVPNPVAAPAHEAEHADVGTYVKVAVILTVVTALEFAVIYIRALTPILVPLLLVMSAAKFALVVLFFMHLKDAPGILWLAAGAGFFWLGILILLTMSDVATRGVLSIPGK